MGKLLWERETYLSRIIAQTQSNATYDEAAKKLLANKIVLAHILKECATEYRECTVEEIATQYIQGEPEIGVVGVHKDESNVRTQTTTSVVEGVAVEDSSLTEGKVYYDIRFHAMAPGKEQVGDIRLIMNVEAQNRFRPGYPIVKRGVYYGGRLLSSQYGPVFTNVEYDKIRKVYSIWICTNPPKEFRNTITRYAIQPECLVGNTVESRENYDLLSVVMVCLGEPGTEGYAGLLEFLEVLFSQDRTAEEKKRILESDFDVPMTEQFEREVRDMCNLSEGVYEKGLERGFEQGIEQGFHNGQNQINRLTSILLEKNLMDDLRRCTEDKDYQRELLVKYKIISEA
ncbi:MAG: hypothetical protein PUB19_00840 [Lachnospiraceae bacterium]|nr:hypothetical protein [Lachnospiraceae bacterium]